MRLEWAPALSMGVDELDREQKAFFALFNHLDDAMKRGSALSEVVDVMTLLRPCAERHFAHEEAEMERYGYPDLDSHKAEHQALYRTGLALQRALSEGANLAMTLEVPQYLSDWVNNHAMRGDIAFHRPA